MAGRDLDEDNSDYMPVAKPAASNEIGLANNGTHFNYAETASMVGGNRTYMQDARIGVSPTYGPNDAPNSAHSYNAHELNLYQAHLKELAGTKSHGTIAEPSKEGDRSARGANPGSQPPLPG